MSPKRPERLAVGEYVLGDGEVRHQAEFLEHDADARLLGLLRAAKGHFAAVEIKMPFIRMVRACQDMNERGFPRAVLAHKGQDLAALGIQCHVR